MSRNSSPNRANSPRLPLAGWTLLLALVDQGSKAWMVSAMVTGEHRPIIPEVFQLTLTYNTGAAFSLFRSQPVLLTGVTSLIFLAIAAYAFSRKRLGRMEGLSLALILGGALGNLIDRFRLGKVVDFLDVVAIHYPVFNLADTFIFCGVVLLVAAHLRQPAASSHDPG